MILAKSLVNSAGMEKMTVEFANAMICNGYAVEILLQDSNIESFYKLDSSINISSLHSYSLYSIYSIKKIRKIVLESKVDYLINIGVALSRLSLVALWNTKVKVITWEHFNLYAGSWLRFLWRLISVRFSYKTVVLTNEDYRAYRKFVSSASIVTIYNFTTIDVKQVSNLNSEVVLAVGRLEKQKGFDRLIYVWKKVCDLHPSWTLNIVGNGSLKVRLEKMVKDLNLQSSVNILPATTNIEDYYTKASLYVMSSRYEGFGLVLIEAKMFGLPCVSFDCKYGPSEIIRSGIDGFIVKDGDINGLADCLNKLMENRTLLKSYGANALQDAHNRFSIDSVMKKWVLILE